MTGIICAMKIEADDIKTAMTDANEETVSGIAFTSGKIGGADAVLAVCGVGKVFAAAAAEAMILKYAPDVIINTGVAGTLTRELTIGDIAVATGVVQHDMDTSPLGDPVGFISGINKIVIESDTETSDKISSIAKSLGAGVVRGIVASGDKFVDSEGAKREIRERFNAVACEMEGAAIGQICLINNVKFAVIRAISDGEGGAVDYVAFSRRAAAFSARIVRLFIGGQ